MTTRTDGTTPPGAGPAGAPIDHDPMPSWIAEHGLLTEAQLNLEVGTRWITALRKCAYTVNELAIASLMHQTTIGHRVKKALHSYTSIMAETGIMSSATVAKALGRLLADGWLLREVRALNSRRPAPARPGTSGVGYRLAWPLRYCLGGRGDNVVRCAQITDKGKPCKRRAGWGTSHAGVGPCKLHGGQVDARCGIDVGAGPCDRRAGAGTAHPGAGPCDRHQDPVEVPIQDQAEPEPAPEPALPTAAEEPPAGAEPGQSARPILQLLEHFGPAKPVDNSISQPPLLAPVDGGMLHLLHPNASPGEAGMLHLLRSNASPGEDVFVLDSFSEFVHGITGGSDDHGAELEVTHAHARETKTEDDSRLRQELTLADAHQILDGLPPGRAEFLTGRARMKLGKGASFSAVVLAAATAARLDATQSA